MTNLTCVVCGDTANGINFNAVTCSPCRTFFHRNLNIDVKKLICKFNDQCVIDNTTRKFCTKCRLNKCFAVGMEKVDSIVTLRKLQPKSNVCTNFFVKCLLEMDDDMGESQDMDLMDPFFESQTQLITSTDNSSWPQLYPLFHEIGFPLQELIAPEKCLITELLQSSDVVHKTYSTIEHCNQYTVPLHLRLAYQIWDRFIRMCAKLHAFERLGFADQQLMLNSALMDLGYLRTVLMFDPDRISLAAPDDQNQTTIVVPVSFFSVVTRLYPIERHCEFYRQFKDEWLQDNIIIDILAAIILFRPRCDYQNYNSVLEEHNRYKRLLSRYLSMKYRTSEKANQCFAQLMANLDEMHLLNADLVEYFRIYIGP